jgi:hypothetical protein
MKNSKNLVLMAVLILLSLACGLPNNLSGLVGGGQTSPIEQIWPDVPIMEGLVKSQLDLPLPAQLAIQSYIKSSSQGDAALNFISYTSKKKATDIVNFYNLDKMIPFGWTLKDQPGCQAGSSSDSTSSAGVCFFGKENTDHSGSFLVIFIAGDSKTNETSVFFIRADIKNMPTPQP